MPSFEACVDRHAPWLIAWFTRRLPARADAEDLAQEAFIILHRNMGEIRDPSKTGAYLLGVARRILSAEHKKRAQRRAATIDLAALPAREEGEIDGHEELERALRELPEELELAIETYYSRELTYEQAAEVLGVSRATFQSRLRRALAMLREKLARHQVGGMIHD